MGKITVIKIMLFQNRYMLFRLCQTNPLKQFKELKNSCDVYCDFVTFSFGILEQMWYLIVSIPDHCRLSYFVICLFVCLFFVVVFFSLPFKIISATIL